MIDPKLGDGDHREADDRELDDTPEEAPIATEEPAEPGDPDAQPI